MGESSNEELLRRCWQFWFEIAEGICERVEEVGDGLTAVIDTRIPLVRDSNFLIAERELEAEKIAARADRAFDDLGIQHRMVHARDPALGAPMSEELKRLGWETDRIVFQVLRREPDRPADARIEVEQVSLEDVREVNRAIMAEDFERSPDLVDQVLVRDRQTQKAFGDRWYAARHEGEYAACCRLIQREGIGQIEDVSTLEAARNRGLARAVSLAAVGQSIADGDEITFVFAEADDWPRSFYERLGFDPVGEVDSALRR